MLTTKTVITYPKTLSLSRAPAWLTFYLSLRAEPERASDSSFYYEPSPSLAQILQLKPSRAQAQFKSEHFLEQSKAFKVIKLSFGKEKEKKLYVLGMEFFKPLN